MEKNVKVKVQGRSGADLSHRNTLSLLCGTITPVLIDEVIPGRTARLKVNLAAQFPPLVSDTYMNVKLKAEAFFVPHRILCKSFESFYSDFPQRVSLSDKISATPVTFVDVPGRLPVAQLDNTALLALGNGTTFGTSDDVNIPLCGPGSLMDYLGMSITSIQSSASASLYQFNIMPFLAYHKIWEDWYRNPRVQNPAFAQYFPFDVHNTGKVPVSSIPFTFLHDSVTGNSDLVQNYIFNGSTAPGAFKLADGVSLFSLRQRNFGLDMYTGAQLTAQQGSSTSVSVPSSSFTIESLRAMNSIQQFKERNNIPSPRMIDQTEARYGVRMSDGVAQRPICIGVAEYDVYSKGVSQTAPTPVGGSVQNYFDAVASQYGRAYASGSDFMIDSFEAKEPGYIMVLVTLVPKVSYSFGVDPIFERYISAGSITDMANPLLQNVGPEAILTREINQAPIAGTNVTFGYRERYGAWKDKVSRVHGQLLENQTLEQFVLQRSVTSGSTLSSAFLKIPCNFLDSVMVANVAISGVSAWLDMLFDYKVSHPLAEYSIPSLQDPAYEHGKTVVLRKNGQIF